MNLNWLDECANRRLLEITGPNFYSPRTARRLSAETHAAKKVGRVNNGERPEVLDPLALRLKLRAKKTGVVVDAADVRAILADLKHRRLSADEDTVVDYLEQYGDPVRALAAIVEESAGYYEEAQVRY